MLILTFLATLLLGILAGIPIAYVLVVVGIALMLLTDFFNAQIVSQNMILGVDNFLLLAIPFFILAGELMNRGGLSRRIIDVALGYFGHRRGGLGYVAIVSALILASLSGSAIADSAALAAILMPMMRNARYPDGRSVGLLAAGGVIAPIIPPSIAFVVYGSVANVPITQMFMAGIVPGILMAVVLFVAWGLVSRNGDFEILPKADPRQRRLALLRGIPALLLPVVIIGGLRVGIFTPTEAAVIACVYAAFVGVFIYRELTPRDLYEALADAAMTSAAVMFLIAASTVSAWLVTTANLPTQILDLAKPLIAEPRLLVALLVLLTLLLGMVLDFTPLMLILMPVVIPLCQAAGVDLIYFGVVLIMAGSLGLLTPPVGNVLNVVAGVSGTRMDRVIGGVMPFLLAEMVVLLLLVLFPGIVTGPLTLITGAAQ
ncbi:TRAP transporter large permease [Pseudodonghicola flavimaris]|uniref:TRAP transporter large permease protein n=1 Tax=Pseudodonghicola flavimaris TaxID=3050036 RepID=A0ABT7F3L8_9RHOB|nr:TRAP transporter large permease subunit [Pseudodonghicola flavimaris]MDK3019201.1 TRAP transporter large permease subunit [Pseudodonghicola flavimaris]